MKKILFDIVATQPLGSSKRHGGGKYGEIVLYRMIERKIPISCYYDSSKWLNPKTMDMIKENGIELLDIKGKRIDDIFQESRCDIIYSALPQYNLFHYSGCKIVCTVHGLRTLELPADFNCFNYRDIDWKTKLSFLAKKIAPNIYKEKLRKYKLKEWNNPMIQFVTVSYHSANSIKVYFPEMRDSEIPVFYSPSTSSNRDLTKKYSDKYFMMVSGNRSDKNNLRAIKALDMLFSNGYLSDFNVKITGARDDSNFKYKIKNKEKFEFLGFVSEEELEQLYHDAYVFIFPSLNEGFGYPPLEAMHYGVPVLASPFASIPEICENAAMYFNPFSIEEIAARILRVIESDVYEDMSKRALEQYAKITSYQRRDLDSLIDYICAQV